MNFNGVSMNKITLMHIYDDNLPIIELHTFCGLAVFQGIETKLKDYRWFILDYYE